MRALSQLKNTLVTLYLSTTPGMSWSFTNTPPILSPMLKGMHLLQSLTAECIWLFGRQDPSVALDLHSFLPPNLVQLCLIDYWGVAERDSYYPAFPDNSPATLFMETMLVNLYAGYSLSGTNMRSLHIASPCFDFSSTTADDIGRTVHYLDFMPRFQELFARLDIAFSISVPDDFERYQQGPWCSVSFLGRVFQGTM
jgi:hypothetical protein